MWCTHCNIETNEKNCPICGGKTSEDMPVTVYWCDECKIPVIIPENESEKPFCPLCGNRVKYLTTDLRPVFPEERLLVELIFGYQPHELIEKSVWASNSKYYIDGKSKILSTKLLENTDRNRIITELEKHKERNSYDFFNRTISKFIQANRDRLFYLKEEAFNFIKTSAKNFDQEHIVLSFSGGKDSTVSADLVIKAFGNPSLVHIFGDTTLEFPMTTEYATRYRKDHPQAIFQIAKNKDQDFYDVCEDIGPPARLMRWCCFMFKTGPITRVINSLYRNQKILTFYGIRKHESASRAKYNRIEDDVESIKIQQQTVASPIFFWKDIDIWLYILSEKIDFNDAYRFGYDRVGCWCCPNNTYRAQFLADIYMPEQAKKWRDFLIDFAKKIGKPDAEVYVDTGKWKARQGGNGLESSEDVKIKFTNCTAEENAKIYRVSKPVDKEFFNLFIPFGRVAPELGQKLLNEVIVLDKKSNVPILSIQPFNQDGYRYAVKIKTLNVDKHDDLQKKVAYQVRKFNACRKCLKCESLCPTGAITINEAGYYINPEKCVQCKRCVTSKYLAGGCLMDKYLRTK